MLDAATDQSHFERYVPHSWVYLKLAVIISDIDKLVDVFILGSNKYTTYS